MGFVWGDPVGSVVVGEDEAFGCQVGLGGAAKSGQLDGGELIHVPGGGDLLADGGFDTELFVKFTGEGSLGVFLSNWSSPRVDSFLSCD